MTASDAPDADLTKRAIRNAKCIAADGRSRLDISIRHPAAGDAVHVYAKTVVEAARRGGYDKHARYSGARFTPFVLETLGGVNGEARH